MKKAEDYHQMTLKELLPHFCGNPTPFKIIKILDEEDTIEDALKAFNNSTRKRKVIGIKLSSGDIMHLGLNELHSILNGLQHQE